MLLAGQPVILDGGQHTAFAFMRLKRVCGKSCLSQAFSHMLSVFGVSDKGAARPWK